jgi:hypothetical protein
MTILSFEIGTTYANRVNVETLTTLPDMGPASEFYDYSESLPTGDGGRVTRGKPYAIWKWAGHMPTDLFNALRTTYCPGGSASVYIRTLKADYATYAYYTAKMIWPELDSYSRNAKGYTDVRIRFDNLVLYTP